MNTTHGIVEFLQLAEPLLTVGCDVCGCRFQALAAPDTRVDHRCPTPVVGPVWVLVEPEPVRVRTGAEAAR